MEIARFKECNYCREVIPFRASVCPICKRSGFKLLNPESYVEKNEDQDIPDTNNGEWPW